MEVYILIFVIPIRIQGRHFAWSSLQVTGLGITRAAARVGAEISVFDANTLSLAYAVDKMMQGLFLALIILCKLIFRIKCWISVEYDLWTEKQVDRLGTLLQAKPDRAVRFLQVSCCGWGHRFGGTWC